MNRISNKLRYAFLTALCSFFVAGLFAQAVNDSTYAIGISAEYFGDTVLLRWAPLNYLTHQKSKEYGFELRRVTTLINGQSPDPTTYAHERYLLADDISVLPEAEWANINTIDTALCRAGKDLMYLNHVSGDPDSLDVTEAFVEKEKNEQEHLMALMLADRDYEIACAMGWAYRDTTALANREYVYYLRLKDPNDDAVFVATVSTDSICTFAAPVKPAAFASDSAAFITFDITEVEDQYYAYYVEKSSDGGQTFVRTSDLPIYYNVDEGETSNAFKYADSLSDNTTTFVYRVVGVNHFGYTGPASDTVHVKGVPAPLDARPYITWVEERVNNSGTEVSTIWFTFEDSLRSQLQGFDIYRSVERQGPYEKINANMLPNHRDRFNDSDPLYSNYYFVTAIDVNGHPLNSLPHLHQPTDTVPPAPPSGLSGSIDRYGLVHLQWAPNADPDVQGYRVYTANNSGQEFVNINSRIVRDTQFAFRIDLNTLAKWAYFKVQAVDHRENYSDLSDVLALERPDIIPPSPPVLVRLEPEAQGVGIVWIRSTSSDVDHYELQRKQAGTALWLSVKVLSAQTPDDTIQMGTGFDGTTPQTYQYIDDTAEAGHRYEYRLLAIDEAGNQSSSASMSIVALDNGFRGQIENLQINDFHTSWDSNQTTNGTTAKQVLLTWEYPKAEGLHLFRIYRSKDRQPFRAYKSISVLKNRNTTEFFSDNAIPDDPDQHYHFLDRESKPGGHYRYRVMAQHLDGGYSPLSEIVEIILN